MKNFFHICVMGLSQVKVGNDFIYFLSIILQSISIVALPK
ncbi:MAG: hypothetical protein Q607_CBUC00035G0001, partial [Clostridium butyricum DORA_1]